MTLINPFCAVRPNDFISNNFSSKSFELYNPEEIEDIFKTNPHSFLQIIKDNINPRKKLSNSKRFENVKKNYDQFKSSGLLIKDQKPGFYIQELNLNGKTYNGIIAKANIRDYEIGRIKKHENTVKSRELVFKKYLKETRFNADAVLLIYRDQKAISDLIKAIQKQAPTSVISISKNEVQKLWYVAEDSQVKKITNVFESVQNLYIADGHHRTASSMLLSDEENKAQKAGFMAFLIPESELLVQEYNRLVTNLNGLSEKIFLNRLKLKFNVVPSKSYDLCQKNNGFCMYLKRQFYSVSLQENFINRASPLQALDVSILQEEILKPILGIKNTRSDKRLHYVSKNDNMRWIKNEIDRQNYAVGFGLKPVTVDQLKAIADAKMTMPPKSTYIYPKLRSGLTIYEF
tara:strand:+ start:1804 stop:3012 length:1209 start_codon:yes stop_codon:yes gene_type:complete